MMVPAPTPAAIAAFDGAHASHDHHYHEDERQLVVEAVGGDVASDTGCG